MKQSDVLILGSGFGGSLLATILARSGRHVTLVDRQKHPRFAIGESTTPLADVTLRQIAEQFEVPELLPLCSWGSWKRSHPELLCGKKRGFTYLRQQPGQDLKSDTFDTRRLLVAASRSDEHSDTHWLRSDVDQFLFQLAQQSGADCYENADLQFARSPSGWTASGISDDTALELSGRFLIDATGSGSGVMSALSIADRTHELRTNSQSVFAHFRGAATCEQLLQARGILTDSFPFHCDDAAVHQVLDDGWMWQLRFDDDSLSAGFVLDQRTARGLAAADAETLWARQLRTYPFLAEQFREATILRPGEKLLHARRLQRLSATGAGPDWAALPNTIGFIDPLHSTGIAHTLFGVARLARILLQTPDSEARMAQLSDYSATVIREIRFVDELVEGCYAALPSFELWCAWSMLYFAAVTSMEQNAIVQSSPVSFLRANDVDFRRVVSEARFRMQQIADKSHPDQVAAFVNSLRESITPWNHVRLFDPSVNGLYSSTAAPVAAVGNQ